jgi:integrase
VADRRAGRLEAIPASREQGKAVSRAGDRAEGPEEAAPDPEPAEMQAILDACTRLRDRFFFGVLHESGCRTGEALGLRHEDIAAAECEISIVPRENANGARAKSGGRTIPAGPDLIRLYADYLHEEYGSALSDYVLSRRPDNTCCPEPGVIWIVCLECASGQPLFAGEARIIFWLYRIVINPPSAAT